MTTRAISAVIIDCSEYVFIFVCSNQQLGKITYFENIATINAEFSSAVINSICKFQYVWLWRWLVSDIRRCANKETCSR